MPSKYIDGQLHIFSTDERVEIRELERGPNYVIYRYERVGPDVHETPSVPVQSPEEVARKLQVLLSTLRVSLLDQLLPQVPQQGPSRMRGLLHRLLHELDDLLESVEEVLCQLRDGSSNFDSAPRSSHPGPTDGGDSSLHPEHLKDPPEKS